MSEFSENWHSERRAVLGGVWCDCQQYNQLCTVKNLTSLKIKNALVTSVRYVTVTAAAILLHLVAYTLHCPKETSEKKCVQVPKRPSLVLQPTCLHLFSTVLCNLTSLVLIRQCPFYPVPTHRSYLGMNRQLQAFYAIKLPCSGRRKKERSFNRLSIEETGRLRHGRTSDLHWAIPR